MQFCTKFPRNDKFRQVIVKGQVLVGTFAQRDSYIFQEQSDRLGKAIVKCQVWVAALRPDRFTKYDVVTEVASSWRQVILNRVLLFQQLQSDL